MDNAATWGTSQWHRGYHAKSYLDGLSEQTSIMSGLDHVTFWIISLSYCEVCWVAALLALWVAK